MSNKPLVSFGRPRSDLTAGTMTFSNVSVLANCLPFERYTPDRDYELLGPLR